MMPLYKLQMELSFVLQRYQNNLIKSWYEWSYQGFILGFFTELNIAFWAPALIPLSFSQKGFTRESGK